MTDTDDLLMQPDKQPLMKNGRYWLPHPKTGKWQSWTRATNFAPTLSDRFALSEWELRMALVGATLRPDLVAEATGLDVKTDREKLNRIVKKLKRSAGGEEAADRGTRMHTHTEVLDGGGTLERVPVKERPDVLAYQAALKENGIEVFPHLIERVTAIPELGVAGKLDRVVRLADGTYAIGDVKTPEKLDYKEFEIAIQLALYTRGVNESGLWDPDEERWEPGPEVRTDIGIVMHMPYGKAVCTLYEVPLDRGWEDAALSGTVRKRRSRKVGFKMLGEPVSAPAPTWEERFAQAGSRAALSTLFQAAVSAGLSEERIQSLVGIGQERLTALTRFD